MYVVSHVDELNFFLRRFAPRVTLRVSLDSVEITSAEGYFRAAPFVTFVEEGGQRRVATIGDDSVTNARGVRVNVFSSAPTGEHAANGDFEVFFQAALQRLPKSGGIIRPVVVVENLKSIDTVFSGRQGEMVARVLEQWGAVAAVIS